MNPYYWDSKTVDSYWTSVNSLRNIVSHGILSPLRQKPHGFELIKYRWGTMQLSDLYGNKKSISTWVAHTSWDYQKLLFSRSDDAMLIMKHRNRIGEKSLNILDILRTRKETISMITSNLMSIVKSLNLLKKGKWRKAAAALGVVPKGAPKSQNVPQRWLELQYGWLPLLSDIYAAGNKVFRDPVYSVTTRKRITSKNSGKTERYDFGHYIDTLHIRDCITKQSLTTWFHIKSAAITTLDNLGVLNPTLVAWEALPWSFVLDWFLPVGDFLSSLSALSGVDIISSSQTVTYEVFTNTVSKSRGFTQTSGSGHVYEKTKIRTTPFDISVVLPRFENPLSISHFANGMSLLATAFRSK